MPEERNEAVPEETTAAMSLDEDLASFADAAVADWPEVFFSGEFDAGIRDLCRTHLPFPPSWTPEECDEFISEWADPLANQLSTKFDDLCDTVVERFVRSYGFLPDAEYVSEMLDRERRFAAAMDLDSMIDWLSDEIARLSIHPLG